MAGKTVKINRSVYKGGEKYMPVIGEGFKIKLSGDSYSGNMGGNIEHPAMTREEADQENELIFSGRGEIVGIGEVLVHDQEESARYLQYIDNEFSA